MDVSNLPIYFSDRYYAASNLWRNGHILPFDPNLIIRLLHININHNYFEFTSLIFQQIKGTAIGAAFSLTAANICQSPSEDFYVPRTRNLFCWSAILISSWFGVTQKMSWRNSSQTWIAKALLSHTPITTLYPQLIFWN